MKKAKTSPHPDVKGDFVQTKTNQYLATVATGKCLIGHGTTGTYILAIIDRQVSHLTIPVSGRVVLYSVIFFSFFLSLISARSRFVSFNAISTTTQIGPRNGIILMYSPVHQRIIKDPK